jgi:response regulator of citrate/malate metabolism
MAGCDAYLVKPVGRMTFQNTVCKYLQLREQLAVIPTPSSKLMETKHGY